MSASKAALKYVRIKFDMLDNLIYFHPTLKEREGEKDRLEIMHVNAFCKFWLAAI